MNDFEILTNPTNKQLGEYGEQVFALQCLRRGIIPSKPIGDSAQYDFITENDGHLSRIQVKTVTSLQDGRRFSVNLGRGRKSKRNYEESLVDVFAVYLAEYDVFYLLPYPEVGHKSTLKIYHFDPDKNRYLSHLERWDYLKQQPSN